ncbi:MAG TPA: bifunctional [glutamine synthetase] adenylyltransferase/[glutamine synthetase]-adenylyl-L-tyrosine phosphorylase [Alphaproteobacteria bacterium]|nr:bifunctional [glutamine synthetase] adenylyltransferase/[glutamine synthetase]-adenylyl-L-tyrosine phosphorylase [Alphaproteobacteria bacterium]
MITISPAILPHTIDPLLVRRGEERWTERAEDSGDPLLKGFAAEALADGSIGSLLRATFGNSPFLTQELVSNIGFVREIVEFGPDRTFETLMSDLSALPVTKLPTPAVMKALRQAKRRTALLTGLADIGGLWPLESVTGTLSLVAETTLRQAVAHLLSTPPFAKLPSNGDGLIVLGMGKLGAHELNYSSDIDLVIFYDDTQFKDLDAGSDFVRLARALVRLMEERTGDGYVFRTDLRLRPDPAAMPLAVSLSAAEIYYGSLGQNWERAAMIKARQLAGDPGAGEALFAFLRPWIWRRSLDFAAIEDIHSIKRQINRHMLKPGEAGLLGYNVKLGRGGIREIEFYAQTQQLIFGGRDATLRVPGTCDALRALAAAERIEPAAVDEMTAAYRFLRTVEHRLQMVDDQQTHSLPLTDEGMDRVAAFMAFPDRHAFAEALEAHTSHVHERFSALFGKSPSLSGPGSLVFTGVEDDPETLKTLTGLGFRNAPAVAGAIRGWHHGRHRATRSERAREILTRLTPDLLAALGKTAEPDAAFMRFDAFLSAIPAGVMVLSLLAENRGLLGLVGRIMGMAPALAEQLGHMPGLFEELLVPDFFAPLPDTAALDTDLDRALALAGDYEDTLVRLRRWAAGRKFQAGVHVLESISDGEEAGRFLAAIAETALARLTPLVETEFATKHGTVPGGAFGVAAFGRLGGRVMSFSSDVDLVTIYDAPMEAASGGDRMLDAPHYYIRLTQRLISAITSPMAEGRLYEVDLRLRPSGEAGPVAVALSAFKAYHAKAAWTWEHMALTRARPIAGPPKLAAQIETAIKDTLTSPRDPAKLLADVVDMRRRITEQHPSRSRWRLKYAAGGLVDIEFAVQYLLLREGHAHPDLLTTETAEAIARLAAKGIISTDAAADLARAVRLCWRVQGLIRLTTNGVFEPEKAPAAIKAMLAREIGHATGVPPDRSVDFEQAETILDDILAASRRRYDEIVAAPAGPTQ